MTSHLCWYYEQQHVCLCVGLRVVCVQQQPSPTRSQHKSNNEQPSNNRNQHIQQTRVALMVPIIIAAGKTFVCKVKGSLYNITRAVALIAPSESAILWDMVLLARVVFLLLFVWVRVGFRLASRWVLGRVCACGCGGGCSQACRTTRLTHPQSFLPKAKGVPV